MARRFYVRVSLGHGQRLSADAYIFDLDEPQLQSLVVFPYEAGSEFSVDGHAFDPSSCYVSIYALPWGTRLGGVPEDDWLYIERVGTEVTGEYLEAVPESASSMASPGTRQSTEEAQPRLDASRAGGLNSSASVDGHEIRELLDDRKSGLAIEPLLTPDAIGEASVDLRLGRHFVFRSDSSKPCLLPLGTRVEIQPSEVVLTTTHEWLTLPPEMIGWITARRSWAELGLLLTSSPFLAPSFSGQPTVELVNVSPCSLEVVVGMRFASLALARAGRHAHRPATPDSRLSTPAADREEAERFALDATIQAGHDAETPLRADLERVLVSPRNAKGAALEAWVSALVGATPGLEVIARNARRAADELDLLVYSERNDRFYRFAGSPIVIECKHWNERVGAPEIRLLADRLRESGPNVRTGILIAPEGITGSGNRAALAVIRDLRKEGLYVVPLGLDDLRGAADSGDLATVVDDLYLSFTLRL